MPATAEQMDAFMELGPDALRLLVESDGVGGVLCDLAQIIDELANQDASVERYAQRNQWYKCAQLVEQASAEEVLVLGWRESAPWPHRPGFYKPLTKPRNR